MARGYSAVTLVLTDGGRVKGLVKNEDTFSIQIMDTTERLQGYLKENLREVIQEKGSLMPSYGADRLNDGDLKDLIGYLTTLRGIDTGTAKQ